MKKRSLVAALAMLIKELHKEKQAQKILEIYNKMN